MGARGQTDAGTWLTLSSRPDAKLLTKGDNNAADDTELYAPGQDYLVRKDIIGYELISFMDMPLLSLACADC